MECAVRLCSQRSIQTQPPLAGGLSPYLLAFLPLLSSEGNNTIQLHGSHIVLEHRLQCLGSIHVVEVKNLPGDEIRQSLLSSSHVNALELRCSRDTTFLTIPPCNDSQGNLQTRFHNTALPRPRHFGALGPIKSSLWKHMRVLLWYYADYSNRLWPRMVPARLPLTID